MSARLEDVVSAIKGDGNGPLFLPDLTLWHAWHARRGTLPTGLGGKTLAECCRALDVPPWEPVRPWNAVPDGIGVQKTESDSDRTLVWETPHGVLRSHWAVGPDGDWWQDEYPVKSSGDLPAAMDVVKARNYGIDAAAIPGVGVRGDGGQQGAVFQGVVELPMRPFSEIFHVFLGWSEGLMLFMEEPEIITDMVAILEGALTEAEKKIARLPGTIALAPDNLDAQFMPASSFEEYLAPSYTRTAALLHSAGKLLVVHCGGPLRALVGGLARAGVDCVEGISGPPQSDISPAEARRLCGPEMALWGGIPQDTLLASTGERAFEAAAGAAFGAARADRRTIVGVADKVPVDALWQRIKGLCRMT